MTVKPANQPHRHDVMLQMLTDYASHELIPSAHAVDAAQTRLVDALSCDFGVADDAGGLLLAQKFDNLAGPVLGAARLSALQKLFADPEKLRSLTLARFLAMLTVDAYQACGGRRGVHFGSLLKPYFM